MHSERKLAGKVAVSGQDADLAGCQRIVESSQSMTVYVPISVDKDSMADIRNMKKYTRTYRRISGLIKDNSLRLREISRTLPLLRRGPF